MRYSPARLARRKGCRSSRGFLTSHLGTHRTHGRLDFAHLRQLRVRLKRCSFPLLKEKKVNGSTRDAVGLFSSHNAAGNLSLCLLHGVYVVVCGRSHVCRGWSRSEYCGRARGKASCYSGRRACALQRNARTHRSGASGVFIQKTPTFYGRGNRRRGRGPFGHFVYLL